MYINTHKLIFVREGGGDRKNKVIPLICASVWINLFIQFTCCSILHKDSSKMLKSFTPH